MNFLDAVMAPQSRQSREQRVHGVVAAKVAAIEEGGVYRLEYLSMGDGQPSAPARVMVPMAGGERGIHFLPEVGDEVIVAFELGDTNLPIILGAAWNNNDKPPQQAKQSPRNDIRTIVSRLGHELTFDDTAGQGKVALKSKGGHQIILDDTPGAGKVVIKSAMGHSLELDDTPPGKVTLKTSGGSSFSLDNVGQASVESTLQMKLKSTIVQIEGTAVRINTTGQVTSSAVMIDGSLFGLHMHVDYTSGVTGVVVS